MGGTPSSSRIIEDVDRALEPLLIVFRTNGAVFEGLANINGHRRKEVSEGKVSFGEVHKKKVRVASEN